MFVVVVVKCLYFHIQQNGERPAWRFSSGFQSSEMSETLSVPRFGQGKNFDCYGGQKGRTQPWVCPVALQKAYSFLKSFMACPQSLFKIRAFVRNLMDSDEISRLELAARFETEPINRF